MLKEHGIHHILDFNEHRFLQSLKQFTNNGRTWVRTIAGEKFIRPEVALIKTLINESASSVLLEDVAGGGKTCILLDLVEELEQQSDCATPFIRGDHYSSITSIADLKNHGLPADLIPQCAHLAEKRKLVVIIDSLDVLAVGRSHLALQCFLRMADELSDISILQ